MTLTKAHIINAIADQIGFPKNHSSEIVETLLEIIKRTLESGDTMFNIVNTYTRASQMKSLPAESSYRLQRVGGNILSMLN